jgi:monoterpene epsilon-lactone hydrolase
MGLDSQIYVPKTISDEAQAAIRSIPIPIDYLPAADDLKAWETAWRETEGLFGQANEAAVKKYQPTITEKKFGGVPVFDIKPKEWRDNGRALVYTHGGAYTLLSAKSTLMSAIPVAHDTGLRVISVDYTTAPFSKFDMTTDQVITVMEVLRGDGYRLDDLAVFGASAGGALAAGTVLKMRDKGLGLPAAVVLWSPWSDITETGDTYHTLRNADPVLSHAGLLKSSADAYADPKDQKNPYVSPVYGDYRKGFPPTLIQGGTKEIFLSNFVRHYQALDNAGIPVKLDLYEGMWHVFQAVYLDLPESELARGKMAAFLKKHLG